jgi:hypothetical protein
MARRARDALGGCPSPARACQRTVGNECGLAAIKRDILAERAVQDSVVFAREVECVAEDRIGVLHAQSGLETKPARGAHVFRCVSVADEQLRWNASPMRASASEWAAFDESDVHAGGAAVDGGRNRISTAEDDEIVMLGFHANDSSQWRQFLTSQSHAQPPSLRMIVRKDSIRCPIEAGIYDPSGIWISCDTLL